MFSYAVTVSFRDKPDSDVRRAWSAEIRAENREQAAFLAGVLFESSLEAHSGEFCNLVVSVQVLAYEGSKA